MKAPVYLDTPARSLIGRRMLIIGTHLSQDKDSLSEHLRVHARLKFKGERNRFVCFRAGVVVKDQLEHQRFFPVWARLTLVQGKANKYYKLALATTVQVCRGRGKRKRWSIAFDPGTKLWKQPL